MLPVFRKQSYTVSKYLVKGILQGGHIYNIREFHYEGNLN
jgi:hypothetical protein